MSNEGLQTKHQGQRKRRQERESCINNVKLNLNLTSSSSTTTNHHDQYQHNHQQIIDDSTYRRDRSKKNRFQRGSLENVSSNPWGELYIEGESTLRRSHSLAIARREDIFNNLEIRPNNEQQTKPRRAQLIPRAKLIERSTLPQSQQRVNLSRVSSVETLQNKRKSNCTSQEIGYSLITPKFRIGQERNDNNPESNYYSRTSLNANYPVSYEDLPGLSLPNYYPDSKYTDTDDNLSSESCDNSKKYSSCDNLSTVKWTNNDLESISYDDNIVLSTNRPLYDSLKEEHYAKPKTIRGPTQYAHEKSNFYYKEKRKSSSSEISDDKNQIIEDDKISLDYFESDRNFDEIKLNNEGKIVEIDTNSNKLETDEDNINIDSLETAQLNETSAPEALVLDSNENLDENNEIEAIKVEEKQGDQLINEEYKTIVAVEPVIKEEKNNSDDDNKLKKDNKHSHNYLREFLESQKGSRRPLQNFLTKKLSNLSRRNSKELNSSLTNNQYHSLPDITISKNLRKCEKIDRKLRKCEKNNNLLKKTREIDRNNNESRFIVNIGKHFDITANANIPVDFELKIAKVPRKNKINTKKSKNKSDEQFLEAVKNLKDTLNNNNCDDNNHQFDGNATITSETTTKPEIIGETQNANDINCSDKEEEQEITMDLQDEQVKEYKEKLGSMRNYWGKLLNKSNDNNNNNTDNDENDATCKIIDVTTKVEDVKKKFEPPPPPEPEKISKVLATKQLFEQKSTGEKTEKISPIIKETCNYFEKTSNYNNHQQQQQLESLNPNVVEIINKDDNNEHKPVTRTKSNTIEPEFDHVRYRVVKSNLFQKKIFANCDKESQFDGLMQYLQDYSFQELLIDNNIVIIEPIRSKIPHESSKIVKTTKNITPLLHQKNKQNSNENCSNSGLKRHFFYHPIRVNKEVNDDELPNPDTVKQARQFFEGGVKRSQSSEEFESTTRTTTQENRRKCHNDPDKDQCSATNSNSTNISDFGGSQDDLNDIVDNDDDDHCCEQYVSEDILEKIRECGTTVTYYGGQVVKKQCGQPVLTKAIMEEIRNNERRSHECNCRKYRDDKQQQQQTNNNNNNYYYEGVKFRLIKSNSCSSRLELVGANDSKKPIKKSVNTTTNNDNKLVEDYNLKNIEEKNTINETIKRNMVNDGTTPKIIGEEKKIMTQWGDTTKEKTYNGISFIDKKHYNYHNYEHANRNIRKIDDMEFEPYEIA